MTTYTKTTWVDEILAGAERFDIKENNNDPFKTAMQIVLATGITTPGTPVNAANLNHAEQGIFDARTDINSLLSTIAALNRLPVYNNSGVTLNGKDPVVIDPSYTSGLGVSLSNLANDQRAIGVVEDGSTITAGSTGFITISGVAYINVTGVVIFGHSLVISTTSHYAKDSGGGSYTIGMLGYALGAQGGGTGYVLCLIRPDISRFSAQVQVEGYGHALDTATASVQDGTNANRLGLAFLFNFNTNGLTGRTAPLWGGAAMSLLTTLTGSGCEVKVYYLVNPPTGSVTCTGGTGTVGAGYRLGLTEFIALSGVDQGTPIRTANIFGTSVGTSLAVSCTDAVIGDLIIGVPANWNTTGGLPGDFNSDAQTEVEASWSASPSPFGRMKASKKTATTTTEQLSWTVTAVGNNMNCVSVPIKPA